MRGGGERRGREGESDQGWVEGVGERGRVVWRGRVRGGVG